MLYICAHVNAFMHVVCGGQRLSSYHVGSKDPILILRLGSKHLLSHFIGPKNLSYISKRERESLCSVLMKFKLCLG